jgi:RNA polymerase sigma-70 factor, ECF subfamily
MSARSSGTAPANHLRHRKLRQGEPLDEEAAFGGPSPASTLERNELRRRLEAALGQLTEAQREVVLLHDLEGWRHAEIGERLELLVGTVRSHLHHARRRLRQILTQEET